MSNRGLAAPAYLAVGGSLFRSLDGWATWSRVGEDLPASYLSAVAVSPQNAQLVYFAIWDGGGVYRSNDGGVTWRPVFRNLPDPLVQFLMVPAGPVGTVFAVAPYSGVYRSRDRGETWTDVSPPEQRPTNYFNVITHPQHPERVVAQTLRGLWRSNDGGTTWKLWTAGLPPDSSGAPGVAGLNNLTLAPDGAQDVAFVTVYQTLYRSQGGKPWKRIGQIPVNSFAYVNALLAGPGAAPVLLAGQNGETRETSSVLRSRDGGKTWQPLTFLGETVYQLSFLPTTPGRVVAFTSTGAFYSSDLGNTWKRMGNGIAASQVRSLVPAGGQTLVAGLENCPGGLARSPDGGKTWQLQEPRARGAYLGASILFDQVALASAPTRPLRVYAGVMDGALRSDDGGLTWAFSQFNDGISGGRPAAVAVHPTDPNLVYVAGQHGLLRSRDGGRTWNGVLTEHPFNDMSAVAFDPGQPQKILAASWNGGLTQSLDAGTTWQPILGSGEFLRVSALVIHPQNSSLVLAPALFEDEALIYRSVDGGANWAPSDTGIEGVIRRLIFSADGSQAIATGDEGVFRSTDDGRTWQRVAEAPSGARAVLLQGNRTLHVGTGEGVFTGPVQ